VTKAPGIVPDSAEPLWAQAAELIERRAAQGSLPPGRRLPSERELCTQLGISRVTLRRALRHLVDRGVLRSSHGRGWYVDAPARDGLTDRPAGVGDKADREWPNVLESFTETARRKSLNATAEVLRAEVAEATLDEADAFRVAAGSCLFVLERVRLLDGVPVAVDASRVVLGHAPGLPRADFTRASLIEELARAGAEPVATDSVIEARGCPESAAAHLRLAPGDPVLVMRQSMVDADHRVVLVSTITYRGDRYRLRTSFVRGGGGGAAD
jgi:GntR family transcriptional regulator